MTLEYWIYAVTYISIFSFLIIERYKQGHAFTITKRDALFLLIDAIAKLVTLALSVYAMLWIVNLISSFEILSVSNLPIPMFLSAVMAFLLIDFFHYFSHRLHHKIPALWRFHRLHHADKSVDALTSVLHHPFEVASVFLVSITCYVLFDIPVIIILAHAFVAGLHSPFTHTKMHLPEKFDRFLAYLIITPNFHRLHHSLDVKEGNSNFGIIFPFWDRLFSTYRYIDSKGLSVIIFGVSADKSPRLISLKELLVNPLR
jgi:sterol desaturase/sphingolipid hydroxylase (fatty acid hydroxylase superfamily)